MKRKLKVTVLLGGPSHERDVSLRSGGAAAQALRSLGHTVVEIDPRLSSWTLPPATDVVFLALHGTYGEDGTVQSVLEGLGVPYTGCGVAASQLAFNKVRSKERFLDAGIPTPRFAVLESPQANWPMGWKPPLVLKPVSQGSSVGLQFVDRVADWSAALEESFRYDSQILMEERIVGRETTVALLGRDVLPVVEIRPRDGSYDYGNKYTVGATEYFCPAPFEAAVTARIQSVAQGAFAAVGGRDYGRVDVMVSPVGEPFVLEVNSLPGMTETSLFPKAAAAAGIDYPTLCQAMIDLALERSQGVDGIRHVA